MQSSFRIRARALWRKLKHTPPGSKSIDLLEEDLMAQFAMGTVAMRRRVEDDLRTMMECGHPKAALNKTSGDPRIQTTMFCRSCVIQSRKENPL